jgi:hypothetical protein
MQAASDLPLPQALRPHTFFSNASFSKQHFAKEDDLQYYVSLQLAPFGVVDTHDHPSIRLRKPDFTAYALHSSAAPINITFVGECEFANCPLESLSNDHKGKAISFAGRCMLTFLVDPFPVLFSFRGCYGLPAVSSQVSIFRL